MVNGFFDMLEDQRFASVGLFFLPVLSKWLTVISMCLEISGLQRWNYFFAGVSYTDINDVIQNYNISAATGSVAQSSYKAADEKRSQFGRFSLDILDRYVIAGSLRRDGTDKFFKDKKYAWFPSVSLAWKIFNEKFMKNIEWVNLLKLRASYGVIYYIPYYSYSGWNA